jgi:hypothetical protein
MKEKLLFLYCRLQNVLWPPEERWVEGQAGLSKIAVTVILVAVSVSLLLAVVALLAPAIMNLAQQTAGQIEGVPLNWGP